MQPFIYPIKITVTESCGIERRAIPHRVGIPFPQGVLFKADKLALMDQGGNQRPIQHKAISFWPDGSIRWLLMDFTLTVESNSQSVYQLLPTGVPSTKATGVKLSSDSTGVHVNNSRFRFDLDKTHFFELSNIKLANSHIPLKTASCYLLDDTGNKLQGNIEKVTISDQPNLMRGEIHLDGHFGERKRNTYFSFSSTLTVFADQPFIQVDFTLRNPKAARHKGGFWDLGDPGSQFFQALIFEFNFEQIQKTQWADLESNSLNFTEGNSRLYQDSSGGQHWDHDIHIDKDGNKTVTFKGYRLTVDQQLVASGNRASPVVILENEDQPRFAAHIQKFWQNFPKAISAHEHTLSLELFPNGSSSPHELQAGEQKTHKFTINLDETESPLAAMICPLNVTLPLQHYGLSNAVINLPRESRETKLDEMLYDSIQGSNNFFDKREKADEYGWRNFGDLWADHETLEHDNDETLVSHYNNQYDPIFGLLKQYLITGDHRFFELADDLARHVADIDIYHTEGDKPEYNNGLFWHTDHYLDGRYCSHRTFSKSHMTSEHVEQSGGGPGPEHCYTSGLLLHHFLTGSELSISAFQDLAEWTAHANEGATTVIGRFFDFLKKDIPKIRRIINGVYLFDYPFPLSRATGNYVDTLLNQFILTGDRGYLERAATIILDTCSAHDDISKRGLLTDIETNWHYTIFLQSMRKYLEMSQSTQAHDPAHREILAAFKHYAHYIYTEEKPYLQKANLLDYPNATWVAQDIRKADILSFYASCCDDSIKAAVIEKARYFFDYSCKNLLKQDAYQYTRMMAILLQNHHVPGTVPTPEGYQSDVIENNCPSKRKGRKLTMEKVLSQSFSDLIHRLASMNLRHELRWIRQRITT
jgi:hypothetical protein